MDRPLEDYLSHFSEVLGEENAPVETLGYEPDTLVVPDAYFPPVSVIREEAFTATYPEQPDEGILSGITVREPWAFLGGERG